METTTQAPITKIETRNITEHRTHTVTRSYGRRLLTAALNGIWYRDGEHDTREVAEFLGFGYDGDSELRTRYGIDTLTKAHAVDGNYSAALAALDDDQIDVEGTEHSYPVVGTEDVTYTRYTVNHEQYAVWYRLDVGQRPFAEGDCWVERIEDGWACNVSFDNGTGVGRMPARFLTPVYAD